MRTNGCTGGRAASWVVAAIIVLGGANGVRAQDQELYQDGYQQAPPLVESILTRDAHRDVLRDVSPDGDHVVIPIEAEFSNLEMLSKKTYRLAMLELTPETNREWRFSLGRTRALKIYSISSRTSRMIELPNDVFVSDTVWSPDGGRLAFLAHLPDSTQVWTADAATGRAEPISRAPVMATAAGRGFGRGGGPPSRIVQWTPDGGVIALLVPPDRGPEPQEGPVASSPIIRRTRKKETPTPTYPFLLRSDHDKDLFRYYTTAQIALLRPGRDPQKIGAPGMFTELSLSPDGNYILAERMRDPLSEMTSYSSFGRELEVIEVRDGQTVSIRKIPLNEGSRGGGSNPTRDLPRDVAWRPDGKGLSLLWREPKPKKDKDGDEGEEEAEDRPAGKRKDRLMQLQAPFDVQQAKTLVSTEREFQSVAYSRDGRYAFAEQSGKDQADQTRRWIVAYEFGAGDPVEHTLVDAYDNEDLVKLPGDILTRRDGNGLAYAPVSEGAAFLQGNGYREDFRPRPFIDRVAIDGGEATRIFEGAEDSFDQPLAILDDDLNHFVFQHESPTDFPDSYLWQANADAIRLTSNQNPFPEVAAAKRIDFEFERRDGMKIHGRLSLPPDYREGTRVPGVFWTYPSEYSSIKDYKRAAIRSDNRNRFHHMSYRNASDIWLTQGYAVIEPDIPIIGKGNQYNDHYIGNLVDSMYAAIRKVDQMGYVDPDRLGHGGHSYGAFATANILAHSPFFKAGIAGDGAYNRTLTPMSFQRERRYIWEAQDIYIEMSPFFQADRIDTPLLMYHGAADNNTGTFVIQSERMLQALAGLGKTAVLYIYPYESHGPRAIETYRDLWSRWLAWFDKYVKGTEPMEAEAASGR